MSTEGARQDGDVVRPDTVTEGAPARGDVRGISDLVIRMITPYLRNPKLHRISLITLAVLAAVCVIACGVRLSPLPLAPLPFLGAAYAGVRQVRSGGEDGRVLMWSSVFLASMFAAFWVMSTVGARLR